MAAEPLLIADDVAELLGVSTRWVRERTRSGEIPHVRLGRFVRYRREQIDQWIEAKARSRGRAQR